LLDVLLEDALLSAPKLMKLVPEYTEKHNRRMRKEHTSILNVEILLIFVPELLSRKLFYLDILSKDNYKRIL